MIYFFGCSLPLLISDHNDHNVVEKDKKCLQIISGCALCRNYTIFSNIYFLYRKLTYIIHNFAVVIH